MKMGDIVFSEKYKKTFTLIGGGSYKGVYVVADEHGLVEIEDHTLRRATFFERTNIKKRFLYLIIGFYVIIAIHFYFFVVHRYG